MYTYRRDVSAGYLVLQPNLVKLFASLAEWEGHYGPGTIVAGRSMGKCFANLAEIDILAVLADAPPEQPLYLIGDKGAFIYVCVTRLTEENFVVVDTFPDLAQFEYERSQQIIENRLTEGIVLYGIQIVLPFILLSEQQFMTIFIVLKHHISVLELVRNEYSYGTSEVGIQMTTQHDVIPPRTVFTIRNVVKRFVWQLNEKLLIYTVCNFCELAINKMLENSE